MELAFHLGQGYLYPTTGVIEQRGFVFINGPYQQTMTIDADALQLNCEGGQGNLSGSGSDPSGDPTGAGFISGYQTPLVGPMIQIQGPSSTLDGCGYITNSSTPPTRYGSLIQTLNTVNPTILNTFDNYYDAGVAGVPDIGGRVLDCFATDPSTQTDRNGLGKGSCFTPIRSGFAQMNTQSVNLQIKGLTCQGCPVGIYDYAGGQITVSGPNQFANTGMWFVISHGGIINVDAMSGQTGPAETQPQQLVYFEGDGINGVGGGRLTLTQGFNYSISGSIPRQNEWLSLCAAGQASCVPHIIHAGAVVDTDSSASVQFIASAGLQFGANTSGYPYYSSTPWNINLSGNAVQRTLDLRNSQGITDANLATVLLNRSEWRFCGDISPEYDQNIYNYCQSGQGPITFGLHRTDIPGTINIGGGPFNVNQLLSPNLSLASCTAGSANNYYEFTASNQACNPTTGLPVAGSETAKSAELTVTTCDNPSVNTPIQLESVPVYGSSPTSIGVYWGSTSGGEHGYACFPGTAPDSSGNLRTEPYFFDYGQGVLNSNCTASLQPWGCCTGAGTGTCGAVAPPSADTGTGGLTVQGLTSIGPLFVSTSVPTPASTTIVAGWPVQIGGVNYTIPLYAGPPTPASTPTPAPTQSPSPSPTPTVTPTTAPTATPTPWITPTPS